MFLQFLFCILTVIYRILYTSVRKVSRVYFSKPVLYENIYLVMTAVLKHFMKFVSRLRVDPKLKP